MGPILRAVISVLTATPLVVDYSGDYPIPTASHSFSKQIVDGAITKACVHDFNPTATALTDDNIELVEFHGNGQGIFTFSADQNTIFLAMAVNNNTIVALHHEDELDNDVRCSFVLW